MHATEDVLRELVLFFTAFPSLALPWSLIVVIMNIKIPAFRRLRQVDL